MPFTLTVGFVGECLFVPQPANATMHVLLPVVPASDTTEPFVAAVCFKSAYLQPGSTSPDGVDAIFPMQRMSLALGNPQQPIDFTIPPEVAPVGAVARRPIVPGVFSDDPLQLLTARVDLFSGSRGNIGEGGDWNYDQGCQTYTNAMNWTIEMEGDQLDLNLASFSGTGGVQASLYPINGSIVIAVYGTPASDLPPNEPTGSPPANGASLSTFAAYYRVFEPPVASEAIPRYCGATEAAGPYTCMVAQSPITPG